MNFMSGRDLFQFNPDLFEDDEGAADADIFDVDEADLDEEIDFDDDDMGAA